VKVASIGAPERSSIGLHPNVRAPKRLPRILPVAPRLDLRCVHSVGMP